MRRMTNPETTVTHTWELQTQRGSGDWQTRIQSSRPMSMKDPEPKRYQEMDMFAGCDFRILHTVTTTTTETTVVD